MFRKSRNTEVTSRRSPPNSRTGTSAWPNLRKTSSSPTTFWSSLPPLTTTLPPEVASPSSSTKVEVDGESKELSMSVTQQSRPRRVKEQTTEKREAGKEEVEKRNERKGRKKRLQTGKKGKKRSQDPEVRL